MSLFSKFFCLDKKFLVLSLVKVGLKLRYRGSSLGYIWSLLVPLFTALTYFFVFKIVMRLQVPNYDVFIIVGVLPWAFFSSTLADGMESVLSKHSLMSKVPIRFNIFPLSISLTHLINLLISYLIIFGFIFYKGIPVTKYFVLLPFLITLLFLIAYSLAVICSVLFVYFRDLRHVLGVIIPVWMYGTPILYPIDLVPENLKKWFVINPVGGFFIASEQIILKSQRPDLSYLILLTGWTFLFFCLANLLIFKFKNNLVEDL